MKTLKNENNNTVYELANLHAAIEQQLIRYGHVSELLTKSFFKELKAFDRAIQREMERREM